jgi:hypothetical protein
MQKMLFRSDSTASTRRTRWTPRRERNCESTSESIQERRSSSVWLAKTSESCHSRCSDQQSTRCYRWNSTKCWWWSSIIRSAKCPCKSREDSLWPISSLRGGRRNDKEMYTCQNQSSKSWMKFQHIFFSSTLERLRSTGAGWYWSDDCACALDSILWVCIVTWKRSSNRWRRRFNNQNTRIWCSHFGNTWILTGVWLIMSMSILDVQRPCGRGRLGEDDGNDGKHNGQIIR